ncbi:TetR/AcrR family transcriptional regulator [Deinococcus ruber]|uniref:TetR family transcriptional regulator n=1 Tax=Deinococcus ruber TaxID=1848197 RepID=A0A918FCD4_9DEIO|nr:TetR/AcrR family transcriptional regulator [Deinococcus ruber]GGR21285.1 TetR family transcriptional regulator [Deinococcus ruber]
MDQRAPGRRERKKAATRHAIADAALRLFLAHGFDAVNVRDVAEAADVSTTTLFKHFSTKEALLFDEGDEREHALMAAIQERLEGTSVLQALLDHVLTTGKQRALNPRLVEFEALIHSSTALEDYARRLNLKLETALAEVIAVSCGQPADDLTSRALAHFALEAPSLARRTPDPEAAMRQIFALLEHGWSAFLKR